MSFDSTQFMAQMAELHNNRDDADVTLNCQGDLIKAHSFILATRYIFKRKSEPNCEHSKEENFTLTAAQCCL